MSAPSGNAYISSRSSSGNIKDDGTVTAAGKGAVCLPTTEKNAQFKKLKAMRDNQTCFDCPNTRPTWASVTHGVLLCLDCSSTHRSMGVHLTFVRSLDLDEWTQRQVDAMRIGGNGNARAFFRKHGFSDLYGGQPDKKYKSKAAVSYRAELAKMVEAEAAKRGEGTKPVADVGGATSLLDNLDFAVQQEQGEEAKRKLAAARAAGAAGNTTGVLSVAKKANELAGASKLVIKKPTATTGSRLTPVSSTGSKLILRKPSSGAGSNLLKKKPSNVASKLRVNKLVTSNGGNTGDDDDFEDVEATQKGVLDAEKAAVQLKADEELARKMQSEMNNGTSSPTSMYSNFSSKPAAAP
eukprot:scaffold189274_cov35-Attheya_sp.AAC.1